jgi:hypothetical protein
MRIKPFLLTALMSIGLLDVQAQQYIPLQTRVSNTSIGLVAKSAPGTANEVHILGLGGINDIANSQKAGGTLSLGAYMILQSLNNWQNGLYVLFNERPANTSDTAIAARSFLFPEIGKRSFAIGYERIYKPSATSDHSFIFFVEASWSKNTITNTDTLIFYSTNLSTGLRYNYSRGFLMGSVTKQFCFNIHPYYQLVSVDSKDFALRNSMLGEDNLPPTFHSIGLYTSLQVAELGLFANFKQVLNYPEHINSRELKGALIVVGALISTDIFRF